MWDGVQDVETQIHFPHNAAIILRTSVMSGDRQNLLRKEALFFLGGRGAKLFQWFVLVFPFTSSFFEYVWGNSPVKHPSDFHFSVLSSKS